MPDLPPHTCLIFSTVSDEYTVFTLHQIKFYMYCSISPPSYSGMLLFIGLFSLPISDTFIFNFCFLVGIYKYSFEEFINDIILLLLIKNFCSHLFLDFVVIF